MVFNFCMGIEMTSIRCVRPLLATALISTMFLGSPVDAANSVKAGVLTVERPTLLSAGFDWRITGDDNHNGKVDVQYRKKGENSWRTGMPLLRAGGGGETVGALTGESRFSRYPVPNMFSGSIFNLTPDTQYEAKFTLSDPDGGHAVRTVTFRTRKEPMPAAGGKVYHVYPADWKGPKQEPSFIGLTAAYYMDGTTDDHENIYELRVKPGDTILVHAGLYKGNQHRYWGAEHQNIGAGLFDGTYYLTGSGTPDKPIAIKAAGDGEVIFDGNGAAVLFNLEAANYNYFEGITVRNTDVAFLLGVKNIAGSSGFTLKHSKLYDIGRGVQDDWSGSKDIYIADNEFTGRSDPNRMMGWLGKTWERFPDYPEVLKSEYAVKVYGQGDVVAYNRVRNFHDGIDYATYGAPDGIKQTALYTSKEIRDRFPESNDFYGNDISNMGDNCIEMDGSGRNMRVFENRCFNLALQALSTQPGYGGANYWIRNIVYNAYTGAVKFLENSAGIMFLNNTVIASATPSEMQNTHFRNNLIVAMGDVDPVFALTSQANTNTADYDGFRPNPGKADAFEWNTPPFSVRLDYEHRPIKRVFSSLADFTRATGQEKHGIIVDYDSFVHVTPPNISDPRHVYNPDDFDFRLSPNSPAVDAGVILPNVTDGFSGKAPDLGAIELGQPMPHYGPRNE
jgi:hypothetical protein